MSRISHYPRLFEPLKLRSVELPNRIMMPPHGNGLATEEFLPSERQAYYFAERAKGGVGLIIWGGSNVHLNSIAKAGRNLIRDERAIPGYRFACDLVHHHGGKIFAQLSHQGRQQTSRLSRLPTWGPSEVPDPLNRQIPKEMESEDFAELLEAYRQSAANAMEGGFDGVEVYAAHGYLLSQMLMPIANYRQDTYGGSLENRIRFPLQVLRTVRESVGSSVPIGLRMNGSDLVAGGMETEELAEVARLLVGGGDVDYISVSGGTYHSMPLWIAEMSVPANSFVTMAARIKRTVSVPVAAVNRIRDPDEAEGILARGEADLIAVARAVIADPAWAQKAREGREKEIRRCFYSNQGCMARATAGLPIGCIYNPAVGFEKEWGEGSLQRAESVRQVVVVGGGPGGLEAARVAALRGHAVTLMERSDRLGGQVNLITKVQSRQGFAELAAYYGQELARLGVTIRMGEEASVEGLTAMGADILVFATGSQPRRDGYSAALPNRQALPGVDQPFVLTAADAFGDQIAPGSRVLIHDEMSNADALMAAEHLLDRGCTVTLTTRLANVGQGAEFDGTTLGPQLERLFRHPHSKFTLLTLHHLTAIQPDHTVQFTHVYSREAHREEQVDYVIAHAGSAADNGLYRRAKVERSAPTILAVGDCVAPRRIMDAIYDAHRLMRTI